MEAWNDKILVKFSNHPKDYWTVDDATKGIVILGGTGSGKTSASGKTLAKKFLKEGWGGLVLCAKTDEADLWRQYCKETGREKDLIVFGNGSVHHSGKFVDEEIVFNPIDYEMKRSGEGAGETQNITNIFMNIYRMGNRIAGENDAKEERFWDVALKRCLNRTIELIKLANEDLTYKNMVRIITSCAEVSEEMVREIVEVVIRDDEEAEKGNKLLEENNNFCMKCLVKSYINVMDDDEESARYNAYELVLTYFTQTFNNLGDRTRSTISESFMGLAEPFLSGLLYRHFSGVTNIYPELVYEEQKIIVLDLPVKEYLEAGITAQCVFKLLFQQAIERRDVNKYPIPIFLWADEAQYFINPYDQIFLTTARGSRAVTVFLSQNISNFLAVMSSGHDTKAKVDSLLGNLSTKIFHANADAETNEYASRLIGQAMTTLGTKGTSSAFLSLNFQVSESTTSHFLPQIQPREFTVLKSGGRHNEFEVESIVFVSGKLWSNNTNFIKTSFVQDFSS
jgi:TraM recognition site of TraD and TraG